MDELQKSLFRHLSVSSTSPSQSVRPSSSSVRNTFGVPLCRRLWNLAKRQDVIAVADMVADTAADMEVHMVADTKVDKVADIVAHMTVDNFCFVFVLGWHVVAHVGRHGGRQKKMFLADMVLHMLADKVAGMVADKKIVLGWYGAGHGGRQGGWSRVLVDWAQNFSTRTLPDLRVLSAKLCEFILIRVFFQRDFSKVYFLTLVYLSFYLH